ncbi:BQ5605_C003g02329 [Microbotryum silenes-dioicae]|uniref:BQ5605_C003g02329 protein n=1 Tax=Microbotryum silenes-dioicae TaxID=796604 RepID=A0A2X0MVW2_9BASI|nr:BQ5605_C003g02329 [Microbotryum silenes-dioicae]
MSWRIARIASGLGSTLAARTRTRASAACTCLNLPSRQPIFTPHGQGVVLGSIRSYAKGKSKKATSKVSEPAEDVTSSDADTKRGKGKAKFVQAQQLTNDENLGVCDLKTLEASMDEAVDKLRVSLKAVVGRVGRVSPELLNDIKVEESGKRRPLAEFGTVSVKGGRDLVVHLFDESFMKAVSAALYASPLSLTPQSHSASSLLVPIPAPTWEKRKAMTRQASDACEAARIAVRNLRTRGQKEIKQDLSTSVVSKEEARSDGKNLDAATKKRTDEIDGIFAEAKKVLMDE